MFGTLFLTALLGAASSCNRAERPHNAGEFYSSSNFISGTTVDYVCHPGYEIIGPQRRTCLDNGSWIPLGLPYCVADIAKGKNVQPSPWSDVESEGTSNCSDTDSRTSHSWYLDLENNYRVVILSVDFERSNASPIDMQLMVGDDMNHLNQSSTCSRFRGTYRSGQTVYFPCLMPLVGRYVVVFVKSLSAFKLPFCLVHVMSDQAFPIEEPSSAVVSTTVPNEDLEQAELKTVAKVLGVTAGTGGVSVLLACAMVFVVQKVRNWYRETRSPSTEGYVSDPLITVSQGIQPALTFFLSTSYSRPLTQHTPTPRASGRGSSSGSGIESVPLPAEEAPQVAAFRESPLL
ncbi:unnamed protein product [Ixodes hexagonus]